MSNLDIVIVFCAFCIGTYLWYKYGGGKAFLDQLPTYADGGAP